MSNTTTTPAAERRRLKEIDRLHTASTGTDPQATQARRILFAATVVAQIRQGREPCMCGWCGSPLSLDDLANAARLVDALDQVAVP